MDNIFNNVISYSWDESLNWSKGHVPYPDENILLDKGSIVEIFHETSINNLNIGVECIFIVHSSIKIFENMILNGSILISEQINVQKIIMNNGLLWLLNNSIIRVQYPIILNQNDSIINDPNSVTYINGSVINNDGIIKLSLNSVLIIDYLNQINGKLILFYNISYSDIAVVKGSKMYIRGEIIIKCFIKNNNILHECKTIIITEKYLNIEINKIIDSCHHPNRYIVSKSSIKICSN